METEIQDNLALHDSAARFLAEQCGFARHLRNQGSSNAALDRALWARFADMGWLGVLVPEADGGLGYGLADALPIVEAMGQQFVAEPYQDAWASMQVLLDLGDSSQREHWLPSLIDGSALMLLAHAEHGAGYDLRCVATRAERVGGGYRLDGEKCAIAFGDSADAWLVSARTDHESGDAEGLSLFIVEAGSAGVHFARHEGICGEPCVDMLLDGVVVPAVARLGPEGSAYLAIEAAHDLLVALACAESVGTLKSVLDSTCEYARTRRQFGQPLSSFQVISHRLVDMFTQVELTRSLASLAADQFGPAREGNGRRRRQLLFACKAQTSTACRLVGEHAVQIHGGIGMTEELALSHQVRRLLSIERRLGDRFEQLGRLAEAVSVGQGLYA
ncbi:acyl-CoA dehydrogenase family protein [Ottowia thiooxydans]|uniref:Alkylation response protein AidB-like acyl-CoA dehydrogenase n=1 Tax=Ottowia thiooxydans TaxID=219182 RepID=A0ABV2QA75_9BURK